MITNWTNFSNLSVINVGNVPWADINSAQIEDGLFASASIYLSAGLRGYTEYLIAMNPIGISGPLTITGIEYRVKGYAVLPYYNTDSPGDRLIGFINNTMQFPNKTFDWPTSNSWSAIYGSSTDTWGATSPIIIQDPSKFGVYLRGGIWAVQSGTAIWYVDCIQCRLTYQSGFFFI